MRRFIFFVLMLSLILPFGCSKPDPDSRIPLWQLVDELEEEGQLADRDRVSRAIKKVKLEQDDAVTLISVYGKKKDSVDMTKHGWRNEIAKLNKAQERHYERFGELQGFLERLDELLENLPDPKEQRVESVGRVAIPEHIDRH